MDVSTRGIDDQDTSHLSLVELIDRSKTDKEALKALKTRKKYELKLVQKFDKTKINTKQDEFWFLVDSNWLNAWSAFVNSDGDPPGPISSKELLNEKKEPLQGLKEKIDYRGVPPVVYYILIEFHGRDSSPDICRFSVDMYAPQIPVERTVNTKLRAVMEAKVQVNKVRPKWVKWSRDEEEEVPEDFSWCCGLTKEHIETFIYWAITCWASRTKSGRGDISYRKYQPLRNQYDELDESRHTQSPIDRDSSDSITKSQSSKSPIRKIRSNRIQDDSSDEDEDDDHFETGPADRNHESGTWFNSLIRG